MAVTTIYLQEACLRHQYIRSKDTSNIVERPERLRAVNVGLAAAVSRLENSKTSNNDNTVVKKEPELRSDTEELATALERLDLASASAIPHLNAPINVVKSTATVDVLNNPAVKYVHGDIERDTYLEDLVKWVKESRDKIAEDGSEIPEGLPQGDLYLCPGSLDAVQGALGTVCEAVDAVMSRSPANSQGQVNSSSNSRRAFVAVRPPGHHCGEDTPCGFCFVNNVAVGAAHAHLKHKVQRIIIFDIDLHHGNGTQSIAWQINEESYRQRIEAVNGGPAQSPGLQVFYGSLHDVLSFPCEDGKAELVQAASVSIHGPHGQYIENIHLQQYQSEEQFWEELYEKQYSRLFTKAGDFVEQTAGNGDDDVLVFISCGFDASEHEYESMSRHNRRVPTSFYYRFARDACKFAHRFAQGRLISVLEGGYSDRALTSGAMAHLTGLVSEDEDRNVHDWWNLENLTALEKATKKRRGGRPSQITPLDPWLSRAVEIFASFDSAPPAARPVIPPSSMSLRERQKPPAVNSGPKAMSKDKGKPVIKQEADAVSGTEEDSVPGNKSSGILGSAKSEGETAQKKLPRVILRLGPRSSETGAGV